MQIRQRAKTSGSVLVMTVITGGVVAIALLGYLGLVRSENVMTYRSLAWNSALAVAEGGVEEALAALYASSATSLTANGWTLDGGKFSKSRPLGTGHYFVTISPGADPIIEAEGVVQVPLSSKSVTRQLRVATKSPSGGVRGLMAQGRMELNGKILVDGFDSRSATASTGGLYNPLKAKDTAFVGTNSREKDQLLIAGTTKIYGRVGTGPGEVLKISSPAVAGNRMWIYNPGNAGKVQPGYLQTDMNVNPSVAAVPALSYQTTASGGTVNGTNYQVVLDTGAYRLKDVMLKSDQKLLVHGDVVLVVEKQLSILDQSFIYIEPGAKLQLYLQGSGIIEGLGINNGTSKALNFACYGCSTKEGITIQTPTPWIGTIYAPESVLELQGPGQLMGAAVGREIRVLGDYQFHYDEAVGLLGSPGVYAVISWNEI